MLSAIVIGGLVIAAAGGLLAGLVRAWYRFERAEAVRRSLEREGRETMRRIAASEYHRRDRERPS